MLVNSVSSFMFTKNEQFQSQSIHNFNAFLSKDTKLDSSLKDLNLAQLKVLSYNEAKEIKQNIDKLSKAEKRAFIRYKNRVNKKESLEMFSILSAIDFCDDEVFNMAYYETLKSDEVDATLFSSEVEKHMKSFFYNEKINPSFLESQSTSSPISNIIYVYKEKKEQKELTKEQKSSIDIKLFIKSAKNSLKKWFSSASIKIKAQCKHIYDAYVLLEKNYEKYSTKNMISSVKKNFFSLSYKE